LIKAALANLIRSVKHKPWQVLGLAMLASLLPELVLYFLRMDMIQELSFRAFAAPFELLLLGSVMQRLARQNGLEVENEAFWKPGLRWMATELLFSARLAPVLMLSLLPGLVYLCVRPPQELPGFLPALLIIILCLPLTALWWYRRCLAPAMAVLQGLSPSLALRQAPQALQGRHKAAAKLMGSLALAALILPWLAQIADGLTALLLSLIILPMAALLDLQWQVALLGSERS
jgi:hypothetical protein